MSEEDDLNLVVTDLHRKITGVGATVRTLLPHIAPRERLVLLSQHPHEAAETVGMWRALKLCIRRPSDRPFRIWHVRRNNEMLWGLIYKHLFRCRLKLVMTSCALRRHSWYPRQLLAAMDGIIATSDAAASYVDNVVATIPHGVDCRRFRRVEDRDSARRALGIPGKHVIGICGRIRPEKGTDLFVEAMIRVLPRFPDFTACIAGRATVDFIPFQKSLQRKIAAAGLEDRILWMGEVGYEQMPQFYSALSLCIAPARYEGFGLVPLEAMACGVPVVASRTGCYPDAIIPGENGALVPCNDLAGLVEALEEMLASPGQLGQLGRRGCEIVHERYSAESEASRIIDVYHQMWSEAA